MDQWEHQVEHQQQQQLYESPEEKEAFQEWRKFPAKPKKVITHLTEEDKLLDKGRCKPCYVKLEDVNIAHKLQYRTDVDSFLAVGSDLSMFKPLGKVQFHHHSTIVPETNKKMIHTLCSKFEWEYKPEHWKQVPLAELGYRSIHMAIYHEPNAPLKFFHQELLQKVFKAAVNKLSPDCASRCYNTTNFHSSDTRAKLNIFSADWTAFVKGFDEELHRLDFLEQNEIKKVFFYGAIHGVQLMVPDPIQVLVTAMGLNTESESIILLQAHIATTLRASTGVCLRVKRWRLRYVFKHSGTPMELNFYRRYGIENAGEFTLKTPMEGESSITYRHCYAPQAHTVNDERTGTLVGFVAFGADLLTAETTDDELRKLASDSLSKVHDLQEFMNNATRGLPLRCEEVHSAGTVAVLVQSIGDLRQPNDTAARLLGCCQIVDLKEWSDYLNDILGWATRTIESIVQNAQKVGIANLTTGKLMALHEAETIIKYNLYQHKKQCDRKTVIRLKEENRLQKISWIVIDEKSYRVGSSNVTTATTQEILDIELRQSYFTRDNMYNVLRAVIVNLPLDSKEPMDKVSMLFSILGSFSWRTQMLAKGERKVVCVDKRPSPFDKERLEKYIKRNDLRTVVGGLMRVGDICSDLLGGDRILAQVLRSCFRLQNNPEMQANITSYVRKHVQCFPLAILHTKHPACRWRIVNSSDKIPSNFSPHDTGSIRKLQGLGKKTPNKRGQHENSRANLRNSGGNKGCAPNEMSAPDAT
ncbi:hypothetical protein QAD02_010425 [Eretmocerus hayati]|uniref:Uncharacterized protein n=1 Tax=Eretmocerus hayati TaxID=131215 RepID=A0ACC2NU75_9HYME|nr:hypothetical protein QAD02_010425 [Eretmocerus hayati]